MKGEMLVITEYDHSDEETITIGLATSKQNAEKVIAKYYGVDIIEKVFRIDHDEYPLCFNELYTLEFADIRYRVSVDVSWIEIDDI